MLLGDQPRIASPLAKAKLRLEFLDESDQNDQLREDINDIDLLIADLIEAERLNQEHSVLVAEAVRIGGFVRSVADQYVEYKGSLEVRIARPDLEFHIDKLRIRLLLTNLLNNAVRHGENNVQAMCIPDETAR